MRSKLKIIIPIIVAVMAIIIAALTINFTSDNGVNISSLIETAQNYLNENKYEQAIAEFEKAIKLDPMNVDAYIGLAQAYMGIGDTEQAIETLEKGIAKTGDQRLKDMLDELSPPEETTITTTTPTTVTTTEAETDQTAITTTVLNDEFNAETILESTTTTLPETVSSDTSIQISNDNTTTISLDNQDKENDEKIVLNQAIEELSKFVPNKQYGTPNSIKYSYYEEYNDFIDEPRYHCVKCEYDNNGSIINEYEIVFSIVANEKRIDNYDEIKLITYDHDNYEHPIMTKRYCKLPDSNYISCESSTYEVANQRISYDELLSSSEIVKISDKEYLAETYNGDYKICLNDNEVYSLENTKYESYSYTLKNGALYKYDDFGTYITPCKDGLPDKISKSDFYILTDNIDKTFTNYLEYCDYARLKWESIGR